jgi:hypothetical protein
MPGELVPGGGTRHLVIRGCPGVRLPRHLNGLVMQVPVLLSGVPVTTILLPGGGQPGVPWELDAVIARRTSGCERVEGLVFEVWVVCAPVPPLRARALAVCVVTGAGVCWGTTVVAQALAGPVVAGLIGLVCGLVWMVVLAHRYDRRRATARRDRGVAG